MNDFMSAFARSCDQASIPSGDMRQDYARGSGPLPQDDFLKRLYSRTGPTEERSQDRATARSAVCPLSVPEPWEWDRTRVEVLDHYPARVAGREGISFRLDLTDHDGGLVEARWPAGDFSRLPYPVRDSSFVTVVVYRVRDTKPTVAVWPVPRLWHPSLLNGA